MAAPREELRQRRPRGLAGPAAAAGAGAGAEAVPEVARGPPEPRRPPAPSVRAGTFWLTRLVLLRATASVYAVAFLVAYHQNKALIGDKGLLPCKLYLENVKRYFKGKVNLDALSHAPTLIWFLDWSSMDSILDNFALTGLAISAFVLVTGCANMILMAALWILYLSLINVGQIWYSFDFRLCWQLTRSRQEGAAAGKGWTSCSRGGLVGAFPGTALRGTAHPATCGTKRSCSYSRTRRSAHGERSWGVPRPPPAPDCLERVAPVAEGRVEKPP